MKWSFRFTVEVISSYFSSNIEKDYLERIKTAIITANSKVIEKAANDSELKGMATTVEVLFLKDNTAYWGHVGDSRIYNMKNGKIKQLTKDHSLVQKLVDEGFLSMKEAEKHPNKNIIMRALGDNSKLEIDLSKLKYNQSDDNRFFVCTDGVSGVINDNEIEETLNQNMLPNIPQKLSDLILERGAPDNFTFAAINIS